MSHNHKSKKISIIIKRLLKSLTGEKVVGNYTIDEILFWKKEIPLSYNLSEKEINNLLLIGEEITIRFINQDPIPDERIFLDNLVKIFKILEKHNRTYNIKIKINNRKLLKQSKLLNYTSNINLTIINGYSQYSKEEYLQEEEKLENLVKDIKESNLSPYEKYLAVYNIVKQFKAYKDNKKESYQSRAIKYILNNKYMVCVGYADLLTVLLDKVGIPSYGIHTRVDKSYENGFTMECIPTNLSPHRRNIIKIDDNKYNIHGIFIADATWDNDIENDLYNNSTLTFDRKKESLRLESLIPEDLFLDFHNFNDFSEKINFYLKRRTNILSKENYKTKIIRTYKNLYIDIMKIIIKLDYSKYQELYQKYNNMIDESIKQFKNNESITLKDIEDIFSNFLTEYYQYIILLSNQKIEENILYEAAKKVKQVIKGYRKKKLNKWEYKTKKINRERQLEIFPYIYNPNEKRLNYLTDAQIKRRTKKKVS